MIPIMGGSRYRAALKGLAIVTVLSLMTFFIFHSTHKQSRANRHIPLRILPLGDSITWGWHPSSQQNGTNGYRAPLLRELIRTRYHSIDFVGTQHSGLMFDDDNEGHVGVTINELRGVMKAGLGMRPNIVLVHVGTHDLDRPESHNERWIDAPTRVGALLDDVLDSCPDAVVLVAQIVRAAKKETTGRIRVFNDALPAVVDERVKKGFKLRVVDHSVISTQELADGLHPSYVGYAHMGRIWYDALRAVSRRELVTPPVTIEKR